MEAIQSQNSWQNPNQFEHWLKHSVLPLVLIGLLFLMPKPWQSSSFIESTLTIELSQEETPTEQPTKEVVKPETNEPQPIISEKTVETPPKATQEVQPVSQVEPVITTTNPPKLSKTEERITTSEAPLNSTDVLNMLQQRPSMELTPEFMPRTSPNKDFYIPQQEIKDWYADIPFLDESIDKPSIEMRFYPEGIQGHLEKFFDKVTYRKTFTTKYGTKIHCALIAGVLAACGWK